jgi:hypothetical protein
LVGRDFDLREFVVVLWLVVLWFGARRFGNPKYSQVIRKMVTSRRTVVKSGAGKVKARLKLPRRS